MTLVELPGLLAAGSTSGGGATSSGGLDVPTFVASVIVAVVLSLIGGGGLLVTIATKRFDRRIAREADERRAQDAVEADARADAAADRAFDRNLRGVKAQEALERRREQSDTVDKMLGHARMMLDAARAVGGNAIGMPTVEDGIDTIEYGRLADTDLGAQIVKAHDLCRRAYRGNSGMPGPWMPRIDELQRGIDLLDNAARQWRSAQP